MLPSSPLTPTLHRPFLVTSSSFSSAVLSSPKSPSFNSSAASASSPRRRLSTFPPDHVPSPTPRRTMSSTLAIQGAVPLLGGEGEKTLLRDLPGAGGGGQGPAPVDDLKEAVAEVKSVIGKKISRSPAGPNVNPLAIIASMLAVSNGRDKVLKLIQYTLKLHLLIRRSPSALAALLRTHILGTLPGLRPIMKKPYGTGLDARLKKTASGLSLARRCLLLGNFINPLLDLFFLPIYSPTFLLSQKGQSTLFWTLLELSSALADDVYTLSRLGLFSDKVAAKSEKLSNKLWVLDILINLSKLSRTRLSLTTQLHSLRSSISAREYEQLPSEKSGDSDEDIEALEEKRIENGWAARKLYMDLTFVGCEFIPLKGYQDSIQILSGFASGIIATRKLVLAHHAKLAKS